MRASCEPQRPMRQRSEWLTRGVRLLPLISPFLLLQKKSSQLVDVLNAILPPREYLDEHGRRLSQAVSSAPSSRDQVITLQMKLDERLQERQARENGICPVREELYSQCFGQSASKRTQLHRRGAGAVYRVQLRVFVIAWLEKHGAQSSPLHCAPLPPPPDELIRQVAIESPERGLLLMRVRDEVRMTISAYQTLYQSSITFGMRKTLQAEQGNSELIKRVGAADAAAVGRGEGT